MNLFVIAHYHGRRYLVVVGNGDVDIYEYETCMFKEPFLFFNLKRFLLVSLDFVNRQKNRELQTM